MPQRLTPTLLLNGVFLFLGIALAFADITRDEGKVIAFKFVGIRDASTEYAGMENWGAPLETSFDKKQGMLKRTPDPYTACFCYVIRSPGKEWRVDVHVVAGKVWRFSKSANSKTRTKKDLGIDNARKLAVDWMIARGQPLGKDMVLTGEEARRRGLSEDPNKAYVFRWAREVRKGLFAWPGIEVWLEADTGDVEEYSMREIPVILTSLEPKFGKDKALELGKLAARTASENFNAVEVGRLKWCYLGVAGTSKKQTIVWILYFEATGVYKHAIHIGKEPEKPRRYKIISCVTIDALDGQVLAAFSQDPRSAQLVRGRGEDGNLVD